MRTTMAVVTLAVLSIASPASAQANNGTQTFFGTETGFGSAPNVYAAGPITAVGSVEVISATEDVWRFPAGDLVVHHVPLTQKESFEPTTCTYRLTETGTAEVVSGTGAYARASWQGTYEVRIVSVGCGDQPRVFIFVLRAQGPISL